MLFVDNLKGLLNKIAFSNIKDIKFDDLYLLSNEEAEEILKSKRLTSDIQRTIAMFSLIAYKKGITPQNIEEKFSFIGKIEDSELANYVMSKVCNFAFLSNDNALDILDFIGVKENISMDVLLALISNQSIIEHKDCIKILDVFNGSFLSTRIKNAFDLLDSNPKILEDKDILEILIILLTTEKSFKSRFMMQFLYGTNELNKKYRLEVIKVIANCNNEKIAHLVATSARISDILEEKDGLKCLRILACSTDYNKANGIYEIINSPREMVGKIRLELVEMIHNLKTTTKQEGDTTKNLVGTGGDFKTEVKKENKVIYYLVKFMINSNLLLEEDGMEIFKKMATVEDVYKMRYLDFYLFETELLAWPDKKLVIEKILDINDENVFEPLLHVMMDLRNYKNNSRFHELKLEIIELLLKSDYPKKFEKLFCETYWFKSFCDLEIIKVIMAIPDDSFQLPHIIDLGNEEWIRFLDKPIDLIKRILKCSTLEEIKAIHIALKEQLSLLDIKKVEQEIKPIDNFCFSFGLSSNDADMTFEEPSLDEESIAKILAFLSDKPASLNLDAGDIVRVK